jgi:hypothetical protein
VQQLDRYAFLAVRGERVIHPAGRAVMTRAMSRPAYLRKMARLMPRMARAIPYLDYVLVSARKPAMPVAEAT